MDYQPYTYLIGWPALDLWYYGSETSQKGRIANPSNLWTKYFTSSKHVKRTREQFGEPEIIEVRKVFSDKATTVLWEHKVLRRLKARTNLRWLNKSDMKIHDRTGLPHSMETRKKMSIKRQGRRPALGKHPNAASRQLMREKRFQWLKSEEGKQWVESQKGKSAPPVPFTRESVLVYNKDPEIIAKRAASNTGKKRSMETRKRISEARKKYLKEKYHRDQGERR